MLAADTVEFAIAEALERKAKMAREILGDPARPGTPETLSREAFVEMLRTGVLPGAPGEGSAT